MILIVDDEKSAAGAALRCELRSARIPAAVCPTGGMTPFLPAAFSLQLSGSVIGAVIASDKEGGTPLIIRDVDLGLYPGENIIYAGGREITLQYIKELLHDYYDTELAVLHRGRVRVSGGEVRFCGRLIKLTKSERLIFNLLFFGSERWHSGESLAKYCLRGEVSDGSACVAVHVCAINAKALRLTGNELVKKRRGLGYRLNLMT